MSKKLLPVLILTLITIVTWVIFQVITLATSSTIPTPTQKQMESLDPNLDKATLEDLKGRLK